MYVATVGTARSLIVVGGGGGAFVRCFWVATCFFACLEPPLSLPLVSPRIANTTSTATTRTMIAVPGPGGPDGARRRGRDSAGGRRAATEYGWSSLSERGS